MNKYLLKPNLPIRLNIMKAKATLCHRVSTVWLMVFMALPQNFKTRPTGREQHHACFQTLRSDNTVTQGNARRPTSQKREPLFTLVNFLHHLHHQLLLLLLLPHPETGSACGVEQLSRWHQSSVSPKPWTQPSCITSITSFFFLFF